MVPRFIVAAIGLILIGQSRMVPAHALSSRALGHTTHGDGLLPSDTDTDFLPNWIGTLLPAIGNLSLLDLALPGTHDSMSYDLSTTISDGANDLPPAISWILHEFSNLTPGDFIRDQAVTQSLTLTEQLNAGIRFIDFRVMFTPAPNASAGSPRDWYCLHFVQSNHIARVYLLELRAWLDSHPKEIVVLALSRHGNVCAVGADQYPGVSAADRQLLWLMYTEIFDGLLIDFSVSATNTTTLFDLISRNHRLVTYVADYANTTASSKYAQDSCIFLDNSCGNDMTNETNTVASMLHLFADTEYKAADKRKGAFFLQSFAGSSTESQTVNAFLLRCVFQPNPLYLNSFPPNPLSRQTFPPNPISRQVPFPAKSHFHEQIMVPAIN